jgi:Glycosyltransferase
LEDRNMLKVLYAGPFETNGVYKGGIAVVVNSVVSFSKLSKEANVDLIPFNTCPVSRKANNQGKINLANINNTLQILITLIKKARTKKVDCIYYNSSAGIPLLKDLIILRYAQIFSKSKTIVHIHYAEMEKVLPKRLLLSRWSIRLLKKMDGVVFLSQDTNNQFIQAGLEEKKTTTIYNFHTLDVEPDAIEKKVLEEKKRSILDIVFLGSINERKGILDLLKALEKISSPFILHVCGTATDDNVEKKFEEQKKNIKNGTINQHGYVTGKEKKEILINGDVLVLPSYAEGFPLVLLEAAAAGCAIISTKVGAVSEVFDNRNGRIIDPGSINQLTNAIEQIASEDLEKIFRTNYLLSKKFTLQSFVNNTDSFIERICTDDKRNK